MTAYPFTPSDAEERIKESIKPVEFKFSDFGTGFMDENLPAIAIDYLMNHQDFPADENYNPKQDPQYRPHTSRGHSNALEPPALACSAAGGFHHGSRIRVSHNRRSHGHR